MTDGKHVVISYERFRDRREQRQQIAAERTRKIGEAVIDGEVVAVSPADPVATPPQPPAGQEHAPKG